MEALERFIRQFEAIVDTASLQKTLEDMSSLLHYTSCYIVTIDDTGDQPMLEQPVGVVSPFMKNWLITMIDPLLDALKSNPSPYYTARLPSEEQPVPNAFALPLGSNTLIRSILLVELPVGVPAIVLEKVSWFWLILGHYAFKAYDRVCEEQSVPFTKREVECIRWVSKGKTSWEVSKILGVSERTVNFHIQNCMKKTNSVNRQQVISKCLLGGII
ncbi:helix-turn-helix domain-containing protein [Halioxenophilus sp. WMMB6]|uniref:helix-turn-helix transcriptional regulator n=1 Tax=Halioxenophilus sp. WMMB6 TaxID=3073815 RepID=UPI00295E2371|nr:helix-turn-helix domain-containing protein [Halioxenophilus sp. WMMB6]